MNTKTAIIAAVVIGILIGGGMLLFNNSKSASTLNQDTPENTQIQEEPGSIEPLITASEVEGISDTIQSDSEVKTINMEAGSFYYSLKEIRVKQGEKIKIVLTSKDMMHDFNIDELGVKAPITKAGDTSTVEFVADKTGEFEYYCSVGQHRKNGQVGTLIVE